MTPERWQKVKDVLAVALETDPGERSVYLDRSCHDDLSLRAEVEQLLAAEGNADSELLNSPAISVALKEDFTEGTNGRIGRRIGPYLIVEEIGAGGMGEVYRAFRADDQYQKEVAIKLVRVGQDSRFVVGRFKNERQALASLDHPNIARLLDGGTTEEGLPYFVMELIEGQPINEYCDASKLTITDRLKLFLEVCSAVQYAHQRLIIHRDLKPSNILVTAEGVPKLLDFGIAKILDPAAVSEISEPTISMYRLLTPSYASPEQIKGETITTASDVYTLGVLLYELLTDRRPYRTKGCASHEIAQAVCEFEPLRPSAVIRRPEVREKAGDSGEITAPSVSSSRDGSLEKLSKRLRGDIDNIVLMVLRKEPHRRYASVEQLARDIRRHLESLPVSASGDTFRYRASKFIHRHTAGVAAAAALSLTVLTGLAATLYEARVAHVQQLRAEQRFNDVRELTNSLMFDVHDSIQDLPGSTPARELLVERALRYLDSLSRDAASDASLQRELGMAYEKVGTVQGNPFGANLGDTHGALESYRKALAIRERLSKSNPGNFSDELAVIRSERLIAAVLVNQGDPDALAKLRDALATAEQISQNRPSSPEMLQELQSEYYLTAAILDGSGDYQEASQYLEKEIQVLEQDARSSPDDRALRRELGRAEVKAGYALARSGAKREGTDDSRRGLQILESLAASGMDAESKRWLAMAHWMIGDIFLLDGKAAEGLHSYQEELRIVKTLAIADPKNAVVQYDLGCAYARVGNALAITQHPARGLAALEQGEKVLALVIAHDAAYSEPRFCLAAAHLWTGEALARTGETAKALQSFQEGLAGWEPLAPVSNANGILAVEGGIRTKIGLMLARLGEPDRASNQFKRALEIAEPIATAKPNILEAQYVVADTYSGLGDLSATRAANSARSPGQRIQDWNTARTRYRQSQNTWKQIHNPGARTPVGFACGNPKKVAEKLAHCDAAIGKLKVEDN